ncbi:MAG: hypothetical protein ACO22W_06380 [Steroidobacteraceae bacterium]
MAGSIGPLVAADEHFNHQIVETHATVLHTDPAWTEKVWGSACSPDGSLAVSFGFGKYVNRNVVDGFGGVSRGVEQWAVRASRSLSSNVDAIDVGPLHYEVIEPLHVVRARLEPNAVQPIAFDLTLTGITPCIAEEREDRRTLTGYRRSADQIRYHQIGTAEGWIELAGQRILVKDWMMARDRSWGVRPTVGGPMPGMQPDPMDQDPPRVLAVWSPVLFGSGHDAYGFMQYQLLYEGEGWRHEKVQAAFEFPDGRRLPVSRIEPRLRFDPSNHRLLEANFVLLMPDGSRRELIARPLQGTGFHLGAGLYLGFDGHYHGEWRGDLHLDGEYFADCSAPDNARRLNQFRDCVMAFKDHATGASGVGICQTWIQGSWPEMGLD